MPSLNHSPLKYFFSHIWLLGMLLLLACCISACKPKEAKVDDAVVQDTSANVPLGDASGVVEDSIKYEFYSNGHRGKIRSFCAIVDKQNVQYINDEAICRFVVHSIGEKISSDSMQLEIFDTRKSYNLYKVVSHVGQLSKYDLNYLGQHNIGSYVGVVSAKNEENNKLVFFPRAIDSFSKLKDSMIFEWKPVEY